MMSRRCALITGATGFIGSCLARRLIGNGWEVHALVRPQSNLRILKDIQGNVAPHVHDGTTGQLCRIVGDAQPDIVFHLASLFLSQHGPDDVMPLVGSNLAFPASLLEAMAQNGVTRLINTGTSWQHFEDGASNPMNLYAATKEAFEAIIRFYAETAGLRAITLKLYDTYGPGDPRQKLVSLLLKAAWSEEPLLMSPGEQRIDLVHVDDVVDAYLQASDTLFAGGDAGHACYAVATGHSYSIKEIVALVEEAVGRPLNVQLGQRPYRDREVMHPWTGGDVLPGWQPKVSLPSGIADLVARGPGR